MEKLQTNTWNFNTIAVPESQTNRNDQIVLAMRKNYGMRIDRGRVSRNVIIDRRFE